MIRKFSDSEIISSIVAEDKKLDAVLKFLYAKNFLPVKQYILSNQGAEEDVKDLFQDSIIITFNAIKDGTFKGASSISTFIYGTARNLWLKELRKRKKIPLDDLNNHTNTLRQVEMSHSNGEILPTLNKLILQLGEDCQTILLDFYYQKLSMTEIMKKFNLSSQQVAKTKKYRCLNQLMKVCTKNGLTKETLIR